MRLVEERRRQCTHQQRIIGDEEKMHTGTSKGGDAVDRGSGDGPRKREG